jgi:hypothetical protein
MTKATPKRLVLTSVNQVIVLAKNNPIIAEKLPKLAKLIDMPLSEAPKKSCNCGTKQNFTTPDPNKQITESILSSLSSEDFLQIKNVLGLAELCYYKRVNDKLSLICT